METLGIDLGSGRDDRVGPGTQLVEEFRKAISEPRGQGNGESLVAPGDLEGIAVPGPETPLPALSAAVRQTAAQAEPESPDPLSIRVPVRGLTAPVSTAPAAVFTFTSSAPSALRAPVTPLQKRGRSSSPEYRPEKKPKPLRLQGLTLSRHSNRLEVNGYLRQALDLVEEAAKKAGNREAFKAIKAAIVTELTGEEPLTSGVKSGVNSGANSGANSKKPLEKSREKIPLPSQQKSYSDALKDGWKAVTKGGKVTRQVEKPTEKKTVQQPSQPPIQKTGNQNGRREKEVKSTSQLVITTSRETLLPILDPPTIRTGINQAVGKRAVLRVEKSPKGNIVVTTNTTILSPEELKGQYDQWKSVLSKWPITGLIVPTQWYKLVAHGIPRTGLTTFVEDVTLDNPVQAVLGNPRWLVPIGDKSTGSVVFSVGTEAEASYLERKGLFTAGIRARVLKFRSFSPRTRCYRCQGLGHNPATCTAPPKCKYCTKKHYSTSHRCRTCSASGHCEHLQPKCCNCPGNHFTGDPTCEVVRVLQPAARPAVQPATQLTTPDIEIPDAPSTPVNA
jgi:hypothetical protein